MPTKKSKSTKTTITANAVVPEIKAVKTAEEDAPHIKKAGTTERAVVERDNKLTVRFQLRYSTKFGQEILIVGNHPALGSNKDSGAVNMNYIDQEHWAVEVVLSRKDFDKGGLSYFYLVKNADGGVERSSIYRVAAPLAHIQRISISDTWGDASFIENSFSSDVFNFVPRKSAGRPRRILSSHQFKVKAPLLQSKQVLCIVGNVESLGEWNIDHALLMSPDKKANCWTAQVDLSASKERVHYKYGIYDIVAKSFLYYENGDNRSLFDEAENAENAIVNDGFIRIN